MAWEYYIIILTSKCIGISSQQNDELHQSDWCEKQRNRNCFSFHSVLALPIEFLIALWIESFWSVGESAHITKTLLVLYLSLTVGSFIMKRSQIKQTFSKQTLKTIENWDELSCEVFKLPFSAEAHSLQDGVYLLCPSFLQQMYIIFLISRIWLLSPDMFGVLNSETNKH